MLNLLNFLNFLISLNSLNLPLVYFSCTLFNFKSLISLLISFETNLNCPQKKKEIIEKFLS